MATEETGQTQVKVVKAEDINRYSEPMERHPGLNYRELVGPDSTLAAVGPIIGVYDATIQPGKHYWPRANERDVDRLIYVQGGKGHLHVGEDKHLLRQGDLARIHQGEEKEARLEATGEDRLQLLITIFKVD